MPFAAVLVIVPPFGQFKEKIIISCSYFYLIYCYSSAFVLSPSWAPRLPRDVTTDAGFSCDRTAVFGREIKEIPCIAASACVPCWWCGGMRLPSWGSTKCSLQKRPNYGRCISFVGLKQLITAMRVMHVGYSIPARTFGRAEFSQNRRYVRSQLAVWNHLWSQSLSCKLSKCKLFRDWLFNCAIMWRTWCWWRTRNVWKGAVAVRVARMAEMLVVLRNVWDTRNFGGTEYVEG